MFMEENKEKTVFDTLCEQVEEAIKKITEQKVQPGNIEYLYKLVDVHKDLANETYWKEKIDMRYRNYNEGSYGRRGVPGTGRGRYREGGYNEGGYNGGRGSGRYREGEDMMEEMKYSYGAYSDGNEYGESYRGEGTKELEKMLDYNIMLIEHLKKNAKNQEEMQVIEQKQRELSEI